MNKRQYAKLYRQVYPHGKAEGYSNLIFPTLDKNKNGSICFKEFLIGTGISYTGTFDERLKQAFRAYDVDGNGEVTNTFSYLILIDLIFKFD
jgi:Ca2+-binding EF-hand superfamily protein